MDTFDRKLRDSIEESNTSSKNRVEIELLDSYAGPDGALIQQATAGSAGFDLYAAQDLLIEPGERVLVPCGFKVAMPAGMEMQIRARSGRALKEGLAMANGIGTVDSDFRGEIGVICVNINPVLTVEEMRTLVTNVKRLNMQWAALPFTVGERTIGIKRGERVAQAIFARYLSPELVRVERVDETARGTGGYGSSGR